MSTNLPNNVSTKILTTYPAAVKSFTSTQTAGAIAGVDCSTLASPATPMQTVAGPVPCNLAVLGTGILNATTPRDGLQWGLRGDQVLNEAKDRLDVSLYRTSVSQVFGSPSAYNPIFTNTEPEYTLNAHIDETHAFSPSFLNDFVASYVRLNGLIPCTQCNIPEIDIVDASPLGNVGQVGFIQNNFEYRDNITWSHRAHNLKFGGLAQAAEQLQSHRQRHTSHIYLHRSIRLCGGRPHYRDRLHLQSRYRQPRYSYGCRKAVDRRRLR